jgi:AcrR family transcriptional regulator
MSKKPTSRDLQALETEKKVTDMAMKLVREYGYDRVTISQICEACGVAKGTFYSYFTSKKDILIKLTSRFNKELSQLFIFDESLRAATLYRNMVTSYLNYVNKDGHAFTKSYIKAMIDEELAKENVSLELQKNFIDKVIRKVSLFDTFKEKPYISKEYVITLFLALLELTNNRGMKIYQDKLYGDIIISPGEKI